MTEKNATKYTQAIDDLIDVPFEIITDDPRFSQQDFSSYDLQQGDGEESKSIMLSALEKSSTFVFDGIEDSVVITKITNPDQNDDIVEITIEYDSKYAGYGNRTGSPLFQPDNSVHHVVDMKINLESKEVKRFLVDGCWDELKQDFLQNTDCFTDTPYDVFLDSVNSKEQQVVKIRILPKTDNPNARWHFNPKNVFVLHGFNGTIQWTNEDDSPVRLVDNDGHIDSGDILPGQMWIRTFEKKGLYPYYGEPNHPKYASVTVLDELGKQ